MITDIIIDFFILVFVELQMYGNFDYRFFDFKNYKLKKDVSKL